MQSEARIIYMKKWRKTPAAKAMVKRYRQSAKHKAWLKKYLKTPKMVEYRRAYDRKRSKQPKRSAYRKAYFKTYSKIYENSTKRIAYKKRKIKTDVNYKLGCLLRRRLSHILSRKYRSGSAVRDLGCTLNFLKTYLESKFKPGMTWENWTTNGWHLDHIIPLKVFNLTDKEQFLKACHYTNLQPLWAKDNLKKGANTKWGKNENNFSVKKLCS